MKFDLDVFGSNLDQAVEYIDASKAINHNCRYRIETNVNDETVKVYTISKNKIRLVTHFKNGELFREEKKEEDE